MQRAEQPLPQVPLVARHRANERPPATAMLRGRARDQLLVLQRGHSHSGARATSARALLVLLSFYYQRTLAYVRHVRCAGQASGISRRETSINYVLRTDDTAPLSVSPRAAAHLHIGMTSTHSCLLMSWFIKSQRQCEGSALRRSD